MATNCYCVRECCTSSDGQTIFDNVVIRYYDQALAEEHMSKLKPYDYMYYPVYFYIQEEEIIIFDSLQNDKINEHNSISAAFDRSLVEDEDDEPEAHCSVCGNSINECSCELL